MKRLVGAGLIIALAACGGGGASIPGAPCTVHLFTNFQFTSFTYPTFQYTPPTNCPGPWAKVVLDANFGVAAGGFTPTNPQTTQTYVTNSPDFCWNKTVSAKNGIVTQQMGGPC